MYYIIYSLFYLLSLLPFSVLYLFSDLVAFILEKGMKYRRNIILSNLEIAFPEKTLAEREQICHKFYYLLTDNFIETIKLFTLPRRRIRHHFHVDLTLLEELKKEGKSFNVMLGHFFNWEFANLAFAEKYDFENLLLVYMPIKNQAINRVFQTLRSRFGSKLISAHTYGHDFQQFRRKQFAQLLVSDQNPGGPEYANWVPFFGKNAPFVNGPEKSARFYNTAVVFCNIFPERRGYYKAELTLLTKNARELQPGELIVEFVKFLEASIRKHPANYLWSHRRYKHEFKEEIHGKLLLKK